MRLYIGRHGEAGFADVDDERALTDRGVTTTRRVYAAMADRVESPIQTIIRSPLVRAGQTAQIARELLPNRCNDLCIAPELRPESTPPAIAGLLDRQTAWPVMLVGHQPVLGELLSWLTEEPRFQRGIATSSLYAIDLIAAARGCGSVLWDSESLY